MFVQLSDRTREKGTDGTNNPDFEFSTARPHDSRSVVVVAARRRHSFRLATRPKSSESWAPRNAEIRIVTFAESLLYIDMRAEGTVRWFPQVHNLPHHDAVSGHQTRVL